MNISEACIRRPVMTTLITASLIVFGIFGYRLLAVAALPRVDFPTIQVTATLPGASPETMAASVAGPIERQFSTIAGISSMTSTSSLGQTQITIQFDLKRDIDGAATVRNVTVERTVDGITAIETGLEEGEVVVVDGQLQLTNGTKVSIRTPKAES